VFNEKNIEKKLRKMILKACDELSFYEKDSLNIDFVLGVNQQYIQMALGINALSIEAVVGTIKNILKKIDLKYLKRKQITAVAFFIYYSPQIFPNRIIRFSVTTNSIMHCLELTPEKLRAIKPLIDANTDGAHCSWSFLKRFSDESDKSWNAFQTHPHYILLKGKDIPDFLQVQG
jgi:hypothetical protein